MRDEDKDFLHLVLLLLVYVPPPTSPPPATGPEISHWNSFTGDENLNFFQNENSPANTLDPHIVRWLDFIF
jgi:hypothetical protein